jgi:lipoprotein signal peptidase
MLQLAVGAVRALRNANQMRRRTPIWHRRITASQPIVPHEPAPPRPLRTFVLWATIVVIADLTTKALAARYLGGSRDIDLVAGTIRLVLAHNDQSALGISIGPYTWQINCAFTLVALILAGVLCRPLAVIDRWSPVMLGLIAGAAAGNLYSLITSPRGVVDFVAWSPGNGREIVFNLADVAAVFGLVLTVRAALTVTRVIIAERRVMLRR